jgi:hypothetical protein
MLDPIQKSVKAPPDVSVRIRQIADSIGYSENQFMLQSIESIIGMIDNPQHAAIPRVVWLAASARTHQYASPPLPRRPNRVPRISWW